MDASLVTFCAKGTLCWSLDKPLVLTCIQARALYTHAVNVHLLLAECSPVNAVMLCVNRTIAQVSWCKLEVELASRKAVAAGTAELAKRDAPPLVVAALNLKTVLQAKVWLQQHSGQQHCCSCHETTDPDDRAGMWRSVAALHAAPICAGG